MHYKRLEKRGLEISTENIKRYRKYILKYLCLLKMFIIYIYIGYRMWIWIYKLGLIRQILNRANVGIFPVRQLGIISLDKLSTDPIFRIQCQGKPFLSNQFLHKQKMIFSNFSKCLLLILLYTSWRAKRCPWKKKNWKQKKSNFF